MLEFKQDSNLSAETCRVFEFRVDRSTTIIKYKYANFKHSYLLLLLLHM